MTNRATAPQATRPNGGRGPAPGPDRGGAGPSSPSDPTAGPDADAVASARARLLTHRLDPGHGTCAGCGRPSPCPTANDAAGVVVAGGAWNTLPFQSPPAAWRAGTGRRRPDLWGRARAVLARWAR